MHPCVHVMHVFYDFTSFCDKQSFIYFERLSFNVEVDLVCQELACWDWLMGLRSALHLLALVP